MLASTRKSPSTDFVIAREIKQEKALLRGYLFLIAAMAVSGF